MNWQTRFSSISRFLLALLICGCNATIKSNEQLEDINAQLSLALQSPSYATALDPTPTLRLSGILAGLNVKLYSDSACTTEVMSATSIDTSIDLTVPSLTAGTYTFYAKVFNTDFESDCTATGVSYTLGSCPTNFVPIKMDSDTGTSADFCIAKYEMRNVAGNATSQNTGTNWVGIIQTAAKTECEDLNTLNGVVNKYALPTNEEWMAMARDIESVNVNWSSGTAGSGSLNRGWVQTNTAAATAANSTCLYNTAANTCGTTGTHDQKRTHTLSYGEEIWDVGGNLYEWIDWQVTPANKAYIFADGGPVGAWRDFKDLDRLIASTDEMPPEKWQPKFSTLTKTSGIGGYFAGTTAPGGVARRGGMWADGADAGVYGLNLVRLATVGNSYVGFRCVYRP